MHLGPPPACNPYVKLQKVIRKYQKKVIKIKKKSNKISKIQKKIQKKRNDRDSKRHLLRRYQSFSYPRAKSHD